MLFRSRIADVGRDVSAPGQLVERRPRGFTLVANHTGGGRMKRVTPDLWESNEDYPKSESGSKRVVALCKGDFDAAQGWLLGSSDFIDMIRAKVGQTGQHELPAARRLSAVDPVRIQAAVAAHYGVDRQIFRDRRGGSISRDVAAWLSRQLTSCALRELAAAFGLGHADSVRNLTRRVDHALPDSSKLRQDIARIRQELLKTDKI